MKAELANAELREIDELKSEGNIPRHIAIIMDGNGRWARRRGLPRAAGHQRGVETVRKIVEASARLGVGFLTLYTFSTENWNRPKDEVSTLMRLIVKALKDETDELNRNNIKLATIGNIDALPSIVQRELNEAVEKTAANNRMQLNLALSYSGRWELIEAIKTISNQYKEGALQPDDINEELISSYLQTKGIPDPDLLIRSGGEMRVSNFLLWQIAYSEIYVTDIFWPDFSSENLIEAVKSFQKRERRFGLVSEQLSNNQTDEQNGKNFPTHVA